MTDELREAIEQVEVIIDRLSVMVEEGHRDAVPLLLDALSLRSELLGLVK